MMHSSSHTGKRTSTPLWGGHGRNIGMKMPSAERSKVDRILGLPWGGVLGFAIVLSLSMNVFSVTLNKYQFGLIKDLRVTNFDSTRRLFDAEVDDQFNALSGLDHDISVRRLSSGAASTGTSSTAKASSSSGASKPGASYIVSGAAFGGVPPDATAGSSAHSSGCASSAGSAGSAHGGGHAGHPHDNLLYLFNALVIGAAVMQLSAKYPILQQTIVLFVIGFIFSMFLKGVVINDVELRYKIGKWGDSYNMWMDIDPHLLLFTLLPALLAGDAMTIDTSVAKRVAKQCLYLAGPGVLIGAFSTAIFLNFYIDWNSEKKFILSLCAGSILCATDPVAVVALLKELGASPMLTVQIQGESLLNDGTAIVLYLISYDILSGKEYNGWDVADFLMEKALMAFALGLFVGYFFFGWIRAVSNKLDHHSGMIQIVLTLCCAYWSFILVEGILGLSGVLATVASSLVLAHHMWPYVVSTESMHHVWHTFEALGNVIVFFLAGSITGFIVLDIDPIDFLNLIVIYIVLLIVRASLLFGSRPILQFLHADKLPVTWQDATLMTWGGLRGAVGLALAIQVNIGRAPKKVDGIDIPQIDEKDAQRLLFFVSGIAFLTTLVNATTAPMLVGKLGITALPQARQTLLKMFHQQLVNWSEDSANPPEVTASLKHMLHEAAEEIDHQAVSKDKALASQRTGGSEALSLADAGQDCQSNKELLAELSELSKAYLQIPKEDLQLLGSDLPENKLGQVDDMIELLSSEKEFVDIGMAKVVNQCFLTLVYNNYWKLIEAGTLRPGSPESDVLLTSVRISLSPYRADLVDFQYVKDKMISKEDLRTDDETSEELGLLAEDIPADVPKVGCLPEFVNSWQFNLFITFAILGNSVVVCVEELAKDEENEDNAIWIVMDALFTGIFILEWVLKFAWLKCAYYRDAWNRFDFFLVIAGAAGLVMNIISASGSSSLGNQTRIIKLARLLRTMRFLRVFRLFNARMNSDKFVSMQLARHMKKITTMHCFICAHCMAQNDLVRYFGGNGKIDEKDEAEIARCVLQSQVATYQALLAAANTQQQISKPILHELKTLYMRKKITEGLSHFVEKAHADGAISANEAHAILHPLNHQVSACVKSMNERAEGVLSKKQSLILQEEEQAKEAAKRPSSQGSDKPKAKSGQVAPEPEAPAAAAIPAADVPVAIPAAEAEAPAAAAEAPPAIAAS